MPVANPRTLAARTCELLWNGYASVYDELLHLTAYRRMVELVVAYAVESQPDLICELGCGTGNLVERMARASGARVLGVDPSCRMLGKARRKTAAIRRTGFVRADALTALQGLPTGNVDVVVLCNALYAIGQREALWTEVARVLSPRGRVVICHTDRLGSWPIVQEQLDSREWRAFARPGLYAVGLIDLLIDALSPKVGFEFISYPELADELSRIGLESTFECRCYGGEENGINFIAVAQAAGNAGD